MDVPIEGPQQKHEGRRRSDAKVLQIDREDLITPEPTKLEIDGEDNILVDLSTTKVEMFEHDILETQEELPPSILQNSQSVHNFQYEPLLLENPSKPSITKVQPVIAIKQPRLRVQSQAKLALRQALGQFNHSSIQDIVRIKKP